MAKADLAKNPKANNLAGPFLMAASLELFEALKNAVEASEEFDPWWIDDAKYALRKAEGQLSNQPQ